MPLLTVTLGAGATQVSKQAIYCSFIQMQANGSNVVYYGDSTVTTATGIEMSSGTPGGSNTIPVISLLSDLWLIGTANDTVRLYYVPSIR